MQVRVENVKRSTAVVRRDLNPQWEENMFFNVTDLNCDIVIQVPLALPKAHLCMMLKAHLCVITAKSTSVYHVEHALRKVIRDTQESPWHAS
jgi:hypothetical protein